MKRRQNEVVTISCNNVVNMKKRNTSRYKSSYEKNKLILLKYLKITATK